MVIHDCLGHNLKESTGPITVVSSKNRRITFQECPDDLCGMVDLAKVADLVLLVVDGRYTRVCAYIAAFGILFLEIVVPGFVAAAPMIGRGMFSHCQNIALTADWKR